MSKVSEEERTVVENSKEVEGEEKKQEEVLQEFTLQKMSLIH